MYANEKDYWKDFAADARRLGSPFYGALADAIDSDENLKALAARRKKGQPPPNILLGAVHYLLLKGADHPLRGYYATLGGTGTGEEAFSLFQDFVARHRDEVERLVETKVTNTNEVGRSAVLRAGFGALAKEESAPLHLIEIGPSAGLNVIWDRYGVRYMRDGKIVVEVLPDAPLVLTCDLRSDAVPPVTQMPRIASRVGLELNPVDLAGTDDRDWLRAVIWPDQPHRLDRLDRAIAMFLETQQEIRAGDAVALLPAVLAAIPAGEPACVYHTIATYQFSKDMRDALEAILAGAGLCRPVWHLAFEFDGEKDFPVTLTHHDGGTPRARKLGLAQPHGGWIAWAGD
jgi:hypothetical protein